MFIELLGPDGERAPSEGSERVGTEPQERQGHGDDGGDSPRALLPHQVLQQLHLVHVPSGRHPRTAQQTRPQGLVVFCLLSPELLIG